MRINMQAFWSTHCICVPTLLLVGMGNVVPHIEKTRLQHGCGNLVTRLLSFGGHKLATRPTTL